MTTTQETLVERLRQWSDCDDSIDCVVPRSLLGEAADAIEALLHPIDDITYAGAERVGPLLVDPSEPPEGWRLVPVEPTEEMVEEVYHSVTTNATDADVRGIWSAMLAAAPDYKGGAQ